MSEASAIKLNQCRKFIESNILLQYKKNNLNQSSPVMYLVGSPGMGKSEYYDQLCLDKGWGLLVQYMGTMPHEMITGLPLPGNNDGFTNWSCPELFRMTNVRVEPKGKDSITILLLDDAHLISKSHQPYLFQLLTLKSIHNHKLPNNIIIQLAGNKPGDKAGYQTMLAPIVNRISYLNTYSDVDDWVENYAVKNHIRSDIISFLLDKPSCFTSDPTENISFATARSWTYASNSIDEFESSNKNMSDKDVTTILSGHIPMNIVTEFLEYRLLYTKWDCGSILNGNMPSCENKMEYYSMLSAVTAYLLKILRTSGFKLHTPEMNSKIDVFEQVINYVWKQNRVLVPVCLKQLILGEIDKTKSAELCLKIFNKNPELYSSMINMMS